MSTLSYEAFCEFCRLINKAFLPRGNPQGGDIQLQKTSSNHGTFKPKMDFHEDAEKNLVTAIFELPGMKKEDISIDVQNGHLTVSGEGKAPTEHKEEGYTIRERCYGRYSRTVKLPHGVKAKEVKASMNGGLLIVTFPKVTPDQTPKRVTIDESLLENGVSASFPKVLVSPL